MDRQVCDHCGGRICRGYVDAVYINHVRCVFSQQQHILAWKVSQSAVAVDRQVCGHCGGRICRGYVDAVYITHVRCVYIQE